MRDELPERIASRAARVRPDEELYCLAISYTERNPQASVPKSMRAALRAFERG